MAQVQYTPFEAAKQKIAESAEKISKLFIWAIILGIITIILVIVAVVIAIVGTGASFEFDISNPYELISTMFGAIIGLAVVVLIAGIAFFIIMIMIYINYYQLGKGFDILGQADPMAFNAKNASYGFYAYIIGIIIGFFVPNVGGVVISLLGNIALGVGFYFAYQTFKQYQQEGRLQVTPSYHALVGVSLSIIGNIINFSRFGFGGILSLIGFIFFLIGLRNISREVVMIAPPSEQAAPVTPATPAEQTKFCSNCGAKNNINDKFCANCGGDL